MSRMRLFMGIAFLSMAAFIYGCNSGNLGVSEPTQGYPVGSDDRVTYSFQGAVTEIGSPTTEIWPVKDANIAIYHNDGLEVIRLVTDLAGEFRVWLSEGNYSVSVGKDGYFGATSSLVIPSATSYQQYMIRLEPATEEEVTE